MKRFAPVSLFLEKALSLLLAVSTGSARETGVFKLWIQITALTKEHEMWKGISNACILKLRSAKLSNP